MGTATLSPGTVSAPRPAVQERRVLPDCSKGPGAIQETPAVGVGNPGPPGLLCSGGHCPQIFYSKYKHIKGQEHSSAVECLPSTFKAMGSISRATKKKKKQGRKLIMKKKYSCESDTPLIQPLESERRIICLRLASATGRPDVKTIRVQELCKN